MSATTPGTVPAHQQRNGHHELDAWREHTRVFLQPIAAPSILGLFGFASATFMVSAWLARWYGGVTTPIYLFPFAATFGGLAQFAAGMWAYRARDGLATAMHGMWGSFWLAFGILNLLAAVRVITIPTGTFTPFGYWFATLAVITASGAVAATMESLGLTSVLTTLAVGAGLLAVGYWTGTSTWLHAGGWVLIASAILAWYTATAMMIESTWGRVVLPLGKLGARDANMPGGIVHQPIEFAYGEPGVRHGQ
ncbi:MAG TPA: GPR1/FUN34/YaaH family transporter [Conexibacter sp.]|nr:GPR1/FUN34/YaaH family transporter [Conexibacter sp.]